MSPKLPINNAQTISDFLNLNKGEISEKTSEDSSKFAFDDPAFLARRETLGIRFELELLKPIFCCGSGVLITRLLFLVLPAL